MANNTSGLFAASWPAGLGQDAYSQTVCQILGSWGFGHGAGGRGHHRVYPSDLQVGLFSSGMDEGSFLFSLLLCWLLNF